jgi:membrane associated rhomboid family serine protease
MEAVLPETQRRADPPVVTGAVWLLTALMAAWQLVDPGVLRALDRDPQALAHGQWWRVLSPLLVQSDGWPQIVSNLLFLAAIGYFAEQRFGHRRWVVLYLTGGIVGQLAGYAWEPHGAGSSVAIFGLVGGVLAAAAADRHSVPPLAVAAGVAWIASVAGLAVGGAAGAAVASSLVILVGTQVVRRLGDPRRIYRAAALLAVLLALFLLVVADDHGAPILAGLLVGAALTRRSVA